MPELREAVQDKAHELLDMEGHLESATPEESQDMEQQVAKTHGCVDVLAMHKEAFLELQITEEAVLEYILEPVEELDILGRAYISEPELRDILGRAYVAELEQEEVELQDSGQLLGLQDILGRAYISELELRDILEQEELELRDSGQHVPGVLLPCRPSPRSLI